MPLCLRGTATPRGARDGKVSLTSDSDTEPENSISVTENSESRAGNEQPGGKLDVQIQKDVKGFQEIEYDWKYKGKCKFPDLDQADGEIKYLDKKISA